MRILLPLCLILIAAAPAPPDDAAWRAAYGQAAAADRQGDCRTAIGFYRQADAELARIGTAPDDTNRLSARFNLGLCESKTGDFADARRDLGEVLPVMAALPGQEPNPLVFGYDSLSRAAAGMALWGEQIQALDKAIAYLDRTPDADPLDRADLVLRKAIAMMRAGKLAEGRDLLRATLASQQADPQQADDLPDELNTLGNRLTNAGFHQDAAAIFDRLIAALGPTPSMPLGVSYFNKAAALRNAHDWDGAIEMNRRALAVLRDVAGPTDRRTLSAMGGLGQAYAFAGQLAAAKQWLTEAWSTAHAALGARDPDVALFANNLADVDRNMGAYREAAAIDRLALSIRKAALGEGAPYTRASTRNLALDLQALGQYAEAAALMRGLIDQLTRILGPDHPETMQARETLGELDISAGNLDEAGTLLDPFKDEKTLAGLPPEQRPAVLNHLGALSDARHDPAAAQAFYERAWHEAAGSLGPDHPDTLIAETNALVFHAGDPGVTPVLAGLDRRMLAWAARQAGGAEDARERETLLRIAAQERRLVVAHTLATHTQASLGLLLDAMERWKSVGVQEDRLLAALARSQDAQTATLARRIADQAHGGGDPAALTEARQALIARDPGFAAFLARQNAGAGDIAASLHPGELLIDFWVVPAPTGRARDDELVAVLVRSDGPVLAENLGPLDRITAITGKPDWLKNPQQAAETYLRLLATFQPQIAAASALIIAPDGPLHLVPFEALVTPGNHYLVSEKPVRMVRDARALAHPAPQAGGEGLVIADNIDYGAAQPGQVGDEPLGTAEYDAMAPALASGAFGTVRHVSGSAASKAWLLGLHPAPKILHLATHGIFTGGGGLAQDPTSLGSIELAGANLSEDGGTLTGTEAMRLDLTGTELVVLSACDSALGQISTADGVAGLPSALAVAGARRSLLALWEVSNTGTAAFMGRFYAHLAEMPGQYAEALRAAKLDAIANKIPGSAFQDWKAFVLIDNG